MGMSWDACIGHFRDAEDAFVYSAPRLAFFMDYFTNTWMTLFTGQLKPFLRIQNEVLQGLST